MALWISIILISLYFAPTAQQQPSFTCPNNANPLVSNNGQNLFCTQLGSNSDCPTSSSCVQAANTAGVLICCSSSSTVPLCPNRAQPQMNPNGQSYVTCNAVNPTACNVGYQCVQSSNNPSVYMCCSLDSQSNTCPSDFVPVVSPNGSPMSCTPNTNTCPSGSSCMQSTQSSSFVCCRASPSTRICPNQQNALITHGQLETCTTPGVRCSEAGYNCQFSNLLQSYVCCGNGSIDIDTPKCADNRPTYQEISGETYSCDSTSRCPSGYDCAPSDDPFIDVCCLTGSTPVPDYLSCPHGWNPFRNDVDNDIRTCEAVNDLSCPIGFSCTPSNLPSQFLCCRLASPLVCISGRTLLINGSPKLCTPSPISQCPYTYSCKQSVNPTVTVCCSEN